MTQLLDNLDAQLDAWSQDHALPGYRRAQVRRWLFEKRAADWDAMSDLPKGLRAELAAAFPLWTTRVARHTAAGTGPRSCC